MALEEAGHSSQIQIFWFWCGELWNAGSESPCSGLVRYPLCYHNLQAADNNSHTGGCVRIPRSPQSPYCSLCLPAPVWGTTIQEQCCNFSPARLLGPGRKFQQHQHSELSRRGSAEHAHTGTRGCYAVSSLPSTGESENVLPTWNCHPFRDHPHPCTAHPRILLLLDVSAWDFCQEGWWGGCIRSVFLISLLYISAL